MRTSKDKSKDKNYSPPFSPPLNPFEEARWSGAPESETEEEEQVRIQASQQAINTSREIDQFLQEGKKVMERRRRAVKILLLGQSESGKVHFQLAFAPKHFEKERSVWKIVIQLNVIGSIKTILEALKEEYEPGSTYPATPTDASPNPPLRALRRWRLGLSPLFFIEANLLKILAPECTDSRDIIVRAGSGWKTLLHSTSDDPFLQSSENSPRRRRSQAALSLEHDPTSVLVAQRADIISMWNMAETQEVLQRRRPQFRDSPGFFMDDIARIAADDYAPTDYDIIRARIRTMGVEEHQFVVERGPDMSVEYYIADVGGTRNQRASWAPFFDDVQAILFLAPLAFNQTLEEDVRVNRLEDSLHLWRDICQNKLLANANLVLFFNKKDVLIATLKAGVRVSKYVPTYGDLPNDVPSVTKYFKDKFRAYHKKYSPEPRPFFCYETSAIDIKSMSVLLAGVRESVLRQHLRAGEMI
ncbi:heterotrimeric GTP-binding alpha subunit [Flammula alnicola]|nr:heterotrimeric GTP-binding alpha subunit [Flammula alnicola]